MYSALRCSSVHRFTSFSSCVTGSGFRLSSSFFLLCGFFGAGVWGAGEAECFTAGAGATTGCAGVGLIKGCKPRTRGVCSRDVCSGDVCSGGLNSLERLSLSRRNSDLVVSVMLPVSKRHKCWPRWPLVCGGLLMMFWSLNVREGV